MKKHWTLAPLLALLLLSPAFWMQTRGNTIQYYDRSSGLWHETGASADGLSASDRALLACGLPLEDAAALTRALEDFCS